MEIIPAINCQYVDDVRERVKIASEFSNWTHLDVSDGRFTFNKSWGDASKWASIGGNLKSEVHLMVEEPEKEIGVWLEAGVKRVIIHLETINEKTFSEIKRKASKKKVELMLAVSPETPAEKLRPYFGKISEFQILAIYPGPSGQKFQTLVAEKIKFLRQEMPNATIEVDGGINEETAKLSKSAGADIAVSGSYIFNDAEPEVAYDRLKAV